MKGGFLIVILMIVIVGCGKREPNPELKFAYSYMLNGEYETAKMILDKAKISQDDSVDFKLLDNAVNVCREYLGLLDTAFVFEAPELFGDDDERKGWALFSKGAALFMCRPIEKWDSAVLVLNQSYDIGNVLKIRELRFQSAFMASLCCSNSGNFELFAKFVNMFSENAVTPYQKAISFECKRFLFTMNGEKDSAAHYTREAFAIVKDLDAYPELTNPIYVSYADLIYMDDDSTAEKYLLQVLEKHDYSNPYRILSKIYLKRDNLEKAEEYIAKASSFGDIWYESEVDMCSLFANTYARKGQWEKAFEMQKRIIETEKQKSERINPHISSMQQRYEDEIMRKLELTERRQKTMIIISGLILTILSLLVLALYQKRRHEKLQSEKIQILKESQDKIFKLRAADKTEDNLKEISRLQQKITDIENRYADIYREGRQYYNDIFDGTGNASQWTKADYEKFIEYYKTLDLSLIAQIEESYVGLNPRQIFYKILQAKGFDKERIMQVLGIFTDGAFRALKSKVEAKKREE